MTGSQGPAQADGPSTRAVVAIRPATLDDLAAIRSVLAAHGNDGPVIVADVVGPYVAHLIRHGRTQVAVLDGEIVGFGGAIDAGRAVHLADLFVRPELLGRGIGRQLLAATLEGATRLTTFASSDPRALPLYVRAGMLPLWPIVYMAGETAALPPATASLVTESASSDRLAAIERDWTGVARTADHAYWATMPDVDAFVVRDGAAIVAFGYARVRQAVRIRILDRLVLHPSAEPVATTLAALARAGRGGPTVVCLPGPHPVLRVLLEAGFQIEDRDQFLASDPGIVDPVRLIPNPGLL